MTQSSPNPTPTPPTLAQEEQLTAAASRAVAPSLSLRARRFAQFRANRRGYWSLWIMLALFIISLCAELVANDTPLLIRYQERFYWPLLVEYADTEFGGFLPTPADYRDPLTREEIESNGYMIWPLIPYSYDTIVRDSDRRVTLQPPSWRHWLGTDNQGRDVLARLIYGFRLSLLFGLTLTLFSSIIGIAAGGIQGYFGGLTDLFAQRFIEIWSGLPQLFILIIVASVLVPGFWTLLGVLMLFSWTALVGVVRAEFLRARNFDYVRAAKALGMRDSAIMVKHVLPNAMVATLTFLPFILTGAVVALTALDFLGLGLPPGSPSLGELLRQGKENLQAPWLGLSGFMVMSIMLSLLVFIGEAVRDAFDPRKI